MRKVLYVGRFVPNKGGVGVHIYNIAECLKSKEVNVVYMAYKGSEENSSDIIYDVSLPLGIFRSLLNILDMCFGLWEYRFFKQVIKNEQPDAVILYNKTNAFTRKAIRYCRGRNIRILIENTEWYSLTHISAGLADYLHTRSVDKRIRLTDSLSDGVIAISSYLEKFYRNQGVRVLNLPPIFSINTKKSNISVDYSTIRFIYAGAPGGKDILAPFVNSVFELVENEGINVEFHIYGINPEELSIIMGNKIDYSQKGVFAHGIVNHKEVIDAVSKAHYTILLRHLERYAKAGYSTKVAESLSLGTPVICNRVGGTDCDIENGKTGFVIPDSEEDNLKNIIRYVCGLKYDEYSRIRKNCVDFALRRYSPDIHKENIFNFIFE